MKISDESPSKFSLVIDYWTKGLRHFNDFLNLIHTIIKTTVLLAFLQMIIETSFTISDYVEYIEYVLSIYNKTLENAAITGDNTKVNKSIVSH